MKQFLLLILLPFIACQSSTNNIKDDHKHSTEKLKHKIDSLFKATIQPNGPGAAVLVSYDGEILIGKGYGLRNIKAKEVITKNTNIRLASVSKQFTALSVLKLVDNGLISLTDSIYHFYPYEVFKDITIQHLLNHTSGLADYGDVFEKSWDRNNIVQNKDILHWLESNPTPLFKAGEDWKYSNSAYLVLALIVEKVSRQSFASFATENIFNKAGMSQTNFYNLAEPIELKERALCYEKDSLEIWNFVDGYFMNGVLGDGAVYTSIADYFEYDRALRKNSILSQKSHKLLFKGTSDVPVDFPTNRFSERFPFLKKKPISYAMGWFVTDDYAFHTGGWHGTRTVVIRDLNSPLTIAIFRNSNTSVNDLIVSTFNLVDAYFKKDKTIFEVSL